MTNTDLWMIVSAVAIAVIAILPLLRLIWNDVVCVRYYREDDDYGTYEWQKE